MGDRDEAQRLARALRLVRRVQKDDGTLGALQATASQEAMICAAALASAEARGRLAGLREAAEVCEKRGQMMGVAGYPDADVTCGRLATDLRKLAEEAGK